MTANERRIRNLTRRLREAQEREAELVRVIEEAIEALDSPRIERSRDPDPLARARADCFEIRSNAATILETAIGRRTRR